MTDEIPVIDIGDHLADRPGAPRATARQVHDALTTVGFFVLTGHDVPLSLIERTFAEACRFHTMPMEKRLGLKLNKHNNGYMVIRHYAVRTFDLNNNDKGNLNEAFFVKRERPADDSLLLSGRRFVGPNLWPDEADLPGFRMNVLEYIDTMDRCARRFLPAVAVVLDLPPHWFDEAFEDSQVSFRLSHYLLVATEPNQFGIAPHTDSNVMTFLAQTEVPGLQVRMTDGDWIDVPDIPGSFAVNSGDMLQRWSNARFKSTPHRALPPVGRERYAIPFFFGLHFDQRIECLPACTSPGNPRAGNRSPMPSGRSTGTTPTTIRNSSAMYREF
jgi:isopenicillin N synthase-like dioxygenase